MIVLGIHEGHDAGASIVRDGRIVAAVNEERLVREKLFVGVPELSIKKVMEIAGIGPEKIDRVAVAGTCGMMANLGWTDLDLKKKAYQFFSNNVGNLPSKKTFANVQRILFNKLRKKDGERYLRSIGIGCDIKYVDHHLCHAASAYYTSGKDRCLVVTSDGSGDGMSSTVYIGEDGELRNVLEVPTFHSTAYYYGYITIIAGFKMFRHEGKITGLAAYGDPAKTYGLFERCFSYKAGRPDNTLKLIGQGAIDRLRKELHGVSREDYSAGVQKRTEDVIRSFVADYVKKTGIPDVAAAGGLFANVKVNQRVLEIPGVKSFFVHPHMGDGGIATGAALEACAEWMLDQGRKAKPYSLDNVYFGPGFSDEEIGKVVEASGLDGEKIKGVEKFIAEELAAKRIVGHFNGRMEYGPRALGNRSIIADPTDVTINDWLNKRLHRCYDDKTEILTSAGWKFMKDLDDDEVVATLNAKRNGLEFQRIAKKIDYYYGGEMYRISNRRVDLLVTPNHRMWIKKKHRDRFESKKIEDVFRIKTYHYQKKSGTKWDGKERRFFTLPEVVSKTRKFPNVRIPMDLWLRFLGFWLSEGSFHYDRKGHYRVSVAQSRKSKHLKEIRDILENITDIVRMTRPRYEKKEFTMNSKQLYAYLSQFGKASDKFVPRELLELSERQLRILFESLMKGDGNIRGTGFRYATTSRRLADDVQEMSLKLGLSAYNSIQKAKKKVHRDIYMVRIGRSPMTTVRRGQISKTAYAGKVYCVSVPNRIILVRRNGKTVFCGNSEFMPFAPSILGKAAPEHYEGYAHGTYPARFMTITFDVREKGVKQAPAVSHVDKTARPQVVSREQNPRYYKILQEYEKETGLPVFVNTSFNAHEEPIVCRPQEAINSLNNGCVDTLVMGSWVLRGSKG